MSFIDKNLSGFNYSTVTGRINSKENLLDLSAEVPQFNYKKIAFYNVNVKGTGNHDTLSLTSSIADVYINDSLHFPGTDLRVRLGQRHVAGTIKQRPTKPLTRPTCLPGCKPCPKAFALPSTNRTST